MIQRFARLLVASCGWVLLASSSCAPPAKISTARALPTDALARSNQSAKILLDLEAGFDPESASGRGVTGYDDAILRLGPDVDAQRARAYRDAEVTLGERLSREKDPAVRGDLEILIDAARLKRERVELDAEKVLPFVDVAAVVFEGLNVLLDEGVPAPRRGAALVRLRRYGGTDGQASLCELAMQRIRARLGDRGLVFPFKGQIEKTIRSTPILTAGLTELFAKSGLAGYEAPLARVNEQLAGYARFLTENVLPHAATDFRQPEALYGLALKEAGIDAPPLALAKTAREAFAKVQAEMQLLAPRVAREKGFTVTDYRDVIRALKKEQLAGDALLSLYRKRILEIEAILRREHLIALPARPMRIRLATDAESVRIAAPFFSTPRLLDNTGELGEFVLPTRASADPTKRLDDFSYDAAAWWLTAHEGRPGHELQFSTMLERKVSIARALFAFNSVNAEGWGLYAEDLLRPYMPLDGQLVCLQARLMRAAHAFLDIELNLGLITPDEARRVLREDGVFSEAWTQQSVERYTFTWPAQAPSYFYGYTRMIELRADTARAMGARFDLAAFHDFVLRQGLVPPSLLRKAVFSELARDK